MKPTAPLLVAILLTSVGCNTIGKGRDAATRDLRLRAAQTSDQIDAVNYVIYQHYKRYQATPSSSKTRKQRRDLEIELGKLNDIKDHLETEQIRMLRELKGD